MTIGIGMVGSGFMSRTYAFGIRELLTDATVVAIHGGRQVDAFAREFGLAVEPTLEALLARDDIDVVFLGTPTQTHRDQTLARVEALFPVIKARRAQLAGTLSGGEQQMVAIARGLMARPKLLMIDEPFLGLAPLVVQELGSLVRRIRDEEGISVVFIEQNVELALRLADRGYVLESGRTILSGPSGELLQSDEVRRIFLGDVAL